MRIIITENQLNKLKKSFLNENSLDRKVNKLIGLVYCTDDFDKIRRKRADFLNNFPNARARNGKWLYRVMEWYYNDDIDYYDHSYLNKFLGWLQKNQYPDNIINDSDWSTLSFDDIKKAYSQLFSKLNIANENADKSKVKEINDFIIKRYDSQEELHADHNEYAYEWCILDYAFNEIDDCTCYIVKNKKTYNSSQYISVNDIIEKLEKYGFYDFSESLIDYWEHNYNDDGDPNGSFNDLDKWKKVHEYLNIAETNPNCQLPPYDVYGLSAFVVLIGPDGMVNSVYSRYNSSNMTDGQLMDEDELCNLLGISKNEFNQVFPYVEHD